MKLDLVDTITRGSAFLDALASRPVTVVGFAREAAAAVRRLHAAGAHVRRMEPTAAYTDLTGEALVVVTAAASLRVHAVAAARSAGVRVLSDLDLAWCATAADAFAVAGGRSADGCARVITALLAAHGREAGPLVDADDGGADLDVVLVEPTVDQLAAMQVFRPRVAVLLPGAEPLAPRLLSQQTERDCLLLSADDPGARAVARAGRANVLWLSTDRSVLEHGVSVTRGRRIVARRGGRVEDVCSAQGIEPADLEPALVAVACALAIGLAPRDAGDALTRCLGLDLPALPAGSGARFASASMRSLLRGGARALFGTSPDDASRETVTTGAR